MHSKRLFIILIACFIANSSNGQKTTLFTSGELDSLLYYYKPLYKADSVKIITTIRNFKK